MGTVLMCKDTPVLKFDMDAGEYEVLDSKLLPYQLKGRINEIPDLTASSSRYEITQAAIAMNKNANALTRFFASRVLPLTRENAKKIYNLFSFDQAQDDHSKALIAIACRSVSLQDCYWVKDERDGVTWKDVELRKNPLSEIVAQVALHGSSLTLQGKNAQTPEINGQGAYAKAWKRENGELYLYKLGSDKKDTESRIEVAVSRILDKTNVPHVKYEPAEIRDRFACKCACISSEEHSILSGLDFSSYCAANELSFEKEIMAIDADMVYKMWIVDYLVSNSDRHSMNWGLFYNTDTMEIEGCHPLFDHNNAFDKDLMKNGDKIPSLFDKTKTMKEAAMYAVKRTNFRFTAPVERKDFLSDEQYASFYQKAKELGLDPSRACEKEEEYER